MRTLYILLAVLVTAPAAMAQWTFSSEFPSTGATPVQRNTHGIAVDPDGKVWVQSYYAQSGDSVTVSPFPEAPTARCKAATGKCAVVALYVFNPDGTQASFSPVSIVTLPGGEQDTLGGEAYRTTPTATNPAGQTSFDYNSGRGLATDGDGNVFAAFGGATRVFKLNYKTGEAMDRVRTSELDARGATSPFFDAAGNMYITGVFPADPIAIYDTNLDYVGNVTDKDGGFNRSMLVLPDGNTVFALNYSAKVSTVYQRADEFAAYDSTKAAFRGMAVESATIHPTTGHIWVSAGSPNDVPTGEWAPGRRYQMNTWYEFTTEEVLSNETPVPLDSIAWNGATDGRARGIGFSPDGKIAYVGLFSATSATASSVQSFQNMTTAAEGTIENSAALAQNSPNPFRGETEIKYSLERPSFTRLRVLDLTGREVATLVDGQMSAGDHRATFRPSSLAAGVYVYMLEVDGQATTRRMLHIR